MSADGPTGSATQSGITGSAFCFRLRQQRPGWNALLPIPAKTTIDLAALVCGAPEFLSMQDGGAPCQAAAMVSERGDARVLAAVDESGGVSLVGCPNQLTRGALTAVAQELLAFSGRLWRMPTEEFSAFFEKELGRSLGDYFSGRVAIGWSERNFRAGLKQSLERGRFPVVLLLPDANQDVAEAVAHLRSYNLAVKPLGVAMYDSWGLEVVVPKVLDVAQPGPYEEEEPARLQQRPTPPQPRTPPRSPLSAAQVASIGAPKSESRPEPAPAKKRPWSDQPAPQVTVIEPGPMERAVEEGVPESAEHEPAPAKKRPWSDQPAPRAVDIEPEHVEQVVVEETAESTIQPEPPPAKLKPAAAGPQPATKAPPAARPVWDGTLPGVMAGKRPPAKPSDKSEARLGQEQRAGRR